MKKDDELCMMWWCGSPDTKGYAGLDDAVGRGLLYFQKKYGLTPTVIFTSPKNKEIKTDLKVVASQYVLENHVLIASSESAY